mgnify:FL=1
MSEIMMEELAVLRQENKMLKQRLEEMERALRRREVRQAVRDGKMSPNEGRAALGRPPLRSTEDALEAPTLLGAATHAVQGVLGASEREAAPAADFSTGGGDSGGGFSTGGSSDSGGGFSTGGEI